MSEQQAAVFAISDHPVPGWFRQRDGGRAWVAGWSPGSDGRPCPKGVAVGCMDGQLDVAAAATWLNDGSQCQDAAKDIVGPWHREPEPPDPGEGWRLLDGPWNGCEPEAKREGDGFMGAEAKREGDGFMGANQWCSNVIADGSPQFEGHWYRRRLPSSPAGWSLVPEGELEAGDVLSISGAFPDPPTPFVLVSQQPDYRISLHVGRSAHNMVGLPIHNWRLKGNLGGEYYVIRRDPRQPLAAGDWVLVGCSMQLQQVDRLRNDTDCPSGVMVVLTDGDEWDIGSCRRVVSWKPLDAAALRRLWLDAAKLQAPRGKWGGMVNGHDQNCDTVLVGDLGWFTALDLAGLSPSGCNEPWRYVASDGRLGPPVAEPVLEETS